MDYSRFKHRTDYTNQLGSRAYSPPVAPQSKPRLVHHKPVQPSHQNEQYTISISVNIPDYNRWRVTKFARQYPFLSMGLAIAGLVLFLLVIQGLITVWHTTHNHPLPQALIYQLHG